MPAPRVHERWTAAPCALDAAALLAERPSSAFACLHGEGPGSRWLIHGEDPVWIAPEPWSPLPAFTREGPAPAVQPDLIGFVGYECARRYHPGLQAPPAWFPFPGHHLAVYRRLRVLDRARGVLHEAERTGLPSLGLAPLAGDGPFQARRVWDSDDRAGYQAKVAVIREAIAEGTVYQVNLTRREGWAWSGDLGGFARALARANPAPFSAFLSGPGFAVVSSSPERFVAIRDGRILTSPIKGTAPRDPDPARDRAAAEALLACPKNRSELAMITDLMRNDLARVCDPPSVTLEAFPRLEPFANVHHLVSDVSGRLRPGLDLDGLLAGIFPGGSITGAPKSTALRLIADLETAARDVYTGLLGWCSWDLAQADFSIAIRTAWAVPGRLQFGVGGGVVWDSDPAAEYLETVAKGSSLVQCLSS